MLKEYDKDVWKNDIAFYLDGVSFVHKRNPLDQAKAPCGRLWRRKDEGLKQGCVSKGSKVGHGGKVVSVMVAISYVHGVIGVEQFDKMNSDYCEKYVLRNFEQLFQKSGKESRMFIQDGDPSQNSKKARGAMVKYAAKLLAIPPRSPNLNPIENVFHLVRKELKAEAIEKRISAEIYEEFSKRVSRTLYEFDARTIDKTIESMADRLTAIIKSKGERLKY